MGLDMYLHKKIYIGAHFDHRNVHGLIEINIDGQPVPIKFRRVSEIIEQVAYWRKANAIHHWFVKNCQDGVDECQEVRVSKESLAELLDICLKIQANHELAHELLPTQDGFFFGSTVYDEWYFEDIDYTVRAVSELLREGVDDYNVTVYYQSSW